MKARGQPLRSFSAIQQVQDSLGYMVPCLKTKTTAVTKHPKTVIVTRLLLYPVAVHHDHMTKITGRIVPPWVDRFPSDYSGA